MAILLRSRQHIAQMREAGRLVAETFEILRPHIRPGVTTRELDRIAEKYIRSHGATPAYKGYRGFPATICVAPNNVICHGIPDNSPLHEGDIIGIDIGARLNGWYGDSCVTYPVGAISPEAQRLLDVTQEAMWRGHSDLRRGARLLDRARVDRPRRRREAARGAIRAALRQARHRHQAPARLHLHDRADGQHRPL